MANKPIIELPLPDMERFVELFQDYADRLGETAKVWQELADAISESKRGLMGDSKIADELKSQTKDIVGAISDMSKAQDKLNDSSKKTVSIFDGLGRSVKTVHSSLKGLIGLGGLAGFGLGLAGVGAGMGLFDLASSALNQQKTARGMGLTVGQRNAWVTNMSPYVSENVLSGAANATAAPMQAMAGLAALGLNPNDAANKNATDLASELIDAAHRAYQQQPDASKSVVFQTLQDQFGWSTSDWRNIGTANATQIKKAEKAARTDAGAMGFSPDIAQDWANFEVNLKKAGISLESSLIKGLDGLTGPLGDLSKALSQSLDSLLTSKEVKTAIKDLTDYLSSGEVKTDFLSAMASVKLFGSDLLAIERQLHAWMPNKFADPDAVDLRPKDLVIPAGASNLVQPPKPSWNPFSVAPYDFSAVEKQYGNLPKGLLSKVAYAESKDLPWVTSPKGAQGLFQIMPDVAKSLGIDAYDQGQASYAAGYMISNYIKKYGDVSKALAAYNWGPGNLDADLKSHGDEWLGFAPKETQDYISQITEWKDQLKPPGKLDNSVENVLQHLRNNQSIDNDKNQKSSAPQLHKPTVPQGNKVSLVVHNSTASKVAMMANAAAYT